MAFEKGPDHLEFPVKRLRAELAEGVAEKRLGRALERADADCSGDPVGDPQGPGGNLFGDLVAVGALGA